ncbi:MAG TPA: AEC family transporter [Burkholderiaceae bacterium]|nr:AEC family transporter [Burkholderiaceae bacterium]
MLEVLSITGPIFAVIAVGYAAVRLRWFSKPDIRVIGKFVMSFALPSLLFKALSQRSFGEIMNAGYLAAYALGSIAVMAAGIGIAYFWQKRSLQVSALNGLGMSVSNSGFIGYPIVLQLLGPPAAVALALTLTVENVLMIPLALSLAEAASAGGQKGRAHTLIIASFSRLLHNPLILAIVAGMAVALLGIHLPQSLARAVDMFAVASGAGALFVIGGTLVGLKPANMLGDMARIGAGKLLLHPLAVFGAFMLLPPVDTTLRMAAVTFACMPMLSIYPILAQKYGEEEGCAAALLATTLASFASISAGIWAMHLVFQQ